MAFLQARRLRRKNISGLIEPVAKPWDGPGYIEKDTILTGGSVYSPGDSVKPGALSAAESLGKMKPSSFPMEKGKRRLALANWIVDAANPLTARVIVNRVWSWHFGKAIAGNPNNFGGTGAIPYSSRTTRLPLSLVHRQRLVHKKTEPPYNLIGRLSTQLIPPSSPTSSQN
jgi:hypothetical protein